MHKILISVGTFMAATLMYGQTVNFGQTPDKEGWTAAFYSGSIVSIDTVNCTFIYWDWDQFDLDRLQEENEPSLTETGLLCRGKKEVLKSIQAGTFIDSEEYELVYEGQGFVLKTNPQFNALSLD